MWDKLMGYVPKMTRVHKIPEVIINETVHKEIVMHLPVLMIRKSSRKLQQYCDCFKNPTVAVRELINLKYEISKCRPEVISILFAMSKDPQRFTIEESLTASTRVVDSETKVRFNYYMFSSSFDEDEKIRNPSIYINGEKFLNDDETMMMARIFESLKIMHKNEYTLQQELKSLEEQSRVFQIYANEKL